MDEEKSIEVLNTLIEINNDRIAGYETALNETEESDLKTLFWELKETSVKFNVSLKYEVENMGGTPTDGTKAAGKLYRVWMDVKSAISGKDRKMILNSCEFGEDAAVETYQKVLSDHLSDITDEQQTLLNEQFVILKACHDKVKNLRDAFVDKNKS